MRVKANNVDLYYETYGSGPPLLMLHGNSEDCHIFDKLASKLRAHFTLYLLDSRCQGLSEKTAEFSYDLMAADTREFIRELKIAPVNLVGFSDGGILGLLLAREDQSLLRKMAVLGANLRPEDLTEEGVAFVQRLHDTGKYPLLGIALKEPNIDPASLKGVKTPTLVVAGENDIVKPEVTQEIAASLADARTLILPGRDHLSYVVDQDELYEPLVAFF
ncbi:MAG: alpha/beta hydrolase [Deltaproteobacteria bacterium]|jgi:pimeloyl-ACP methyl ester carboxylesterase|nr:alpha/beta hydrolase [Deltaproteobacteria bacterium]